MCERGFCCLSWRGNADGLSVERCNLLENFESCCDSS